MAKVSPLMVLPPVLFLAIAAMFMWGLGRENPNELPSTLQGKLAPTLKLEPLGDLPVLTDDLIRKPGVKLVNFWASWCVSCRVEHPNLLKLSKAGVTLYGIDYKDKPEDGLKYLSEFENPFLAIGADSGRQAIEFGVYGVPETFVIDGNGRIVLRFPGPITARTWNRTIRPAIIKAGGTAPELTEN
ncbi:MAG: DsbE family thiol:disulfide interchange protein [Paracoccaceae bacterium]|nr:DsbE family thiol:disulfide interchange protein [Paracoccaceae bacterium]